MADPITWRYLGAAEACLQAIKIVDGYHTDAGNYVTREPHLVPESQGIAIAVALDTKDAATDAALRRTHRLVTFVVVAKVAVDAENPQERLHELLDDIEHAFDQRQPAFPAGMQFPVFVDAKPIPPAEGVDWIGALARFSGHVPKR